MRIDLPTPRSGKITPTWSGPTPNPSGLPKDTNRNSHPFVKTPPPLKTTPYFLPERRQKNGGIISTAGNSRMKFRKKSGNDPANNLRANPGISLCSTVASPQTGESKGESSSLPEHLQNCAALSTAGTLSFFGRAFSWTSQSSFLIQNLSPRRSRTRCPMLSHEDRPEAPETVLKLRCHNPWAIVSRFRSEIPQIYVFYRNLASVVCVFEDTVIYRILP